LQKLFAKEASN